MSTASGTLGGASPLGVSGGEERVDVVGLPRSSRRRRVEGGRTRQVKVRLTDDELHQVHERAARAGVTPARWMADAALGAEFLVSDAAPAGRLSFDMPVPERRAWATELMGLRRYVAAISNNVNQLARVANATGEVSDTTAATVEACRRVVVRLEELLADLNVSRREP